MKKYKYFFNILINKIKFIFRPIYRILINTKDFLWDSRLKSTLYVKELDKIIFKILDYGPVTRMRASTFEVKEPETLEWIKGFNSDDKLLDIGANIGIYSLYAASRGINVIAIEPDAQNYALLNLNIMLNNFGNKIMPYCIAVHNETIISKFNISSFEWGGAMNSFDNDLDHEGNVYKPIHSHGVYGTSLDSLTESIPFMPNHLKVDVDGNEYLILLGAKKFLKNKNLKSILIELEDTRSDYSQSIKIIEDSGFQLLKKTHAEMFDQSEFSSIYNHIFVR